MMVWKSTHKVVVVPTETNVSCGETHVVGGVNARGGSEGRCWGSVRDGGWKATTAAAAVGVAAVINSVGDKSVHSAPAHCCILLYDGDTLQDGSTQHIIFANLMRSMLFELTEGVCIPWAYGGVHAFPGGGCKAFQLGPL